MTRRPVSFVSRDIGRTVSSTARETKEAERKPSLTSVCRKSRVESLEALEVEDSCDEDAEL